MKVAIFGAVGTIGRSVTAALLARGDTVRAVGRTEATLREAFGGASGVEIQAADVATAEGCARAAAGVDAIVYAVGLPYTKTAFGNYPSMMHLAVTAARGARVHRLLHVSNVYPYGEPRTPRVREDHPRHPQAVKGQRRKEQEDVALAGHGANGLETLVLRLPDFYGPFADRSLGNTILSAVARGGRATMLGPIDTPHEFMFTPDVGPMVAALLSHPSGWGEAYNFGGAGILTQREFAMRAFAIAGRPPRLRVASPGMVRLMGWVSPMMRELVEMSYLQTHPVLLDDSKLHALLGTVPKTPYEDGIRRTIDHLRVRRTS
ncbi:MAG: NAD(P)H-binding protein [Acidobacteriota bacterium]|nr:NAD(P)H-binding protein [Acidobacteriota bacterium]